MSLLRNIEKVKVPDQLLRGQLDHGLFCLSVLTISLLYNPEDCGRKLPHETGLQRLLHQETLHREHLGAINYLIQLLLATHVAYQPILVANKLGWPLSAIYGWPIRPKCLTYPTPKIPEDSENRDKNFGFECPLGPARNLALHASTAPTFTFKDNELHP